MNKFMTNSTSHVTLPSEKLHAPCFIGGKFVEGKGNRFEITSPWFGKTVGESHESTQDELNQAVKVASEAFIKWSQTPIKERTQVMFKFREILHRDLEKIAHVVSLENGKLISEAKAGLLKGIEVLEFALSLQNSDSAGKMEVSRGVFCEYRREPLGVVASITPFNFPAMVPMWTIPIALTLGNVFIWKPSEKTPLTSVFIAQALQEAGLPDGVFNVLQGGKTIVEALLDHPKIAAISFVGSTKVAKLVYERGTRHGKRVLALGGAKNHIFLLPDAEKEMTGKGIADSFTGCAGQRCMAASVLLPIQNPSAHIEKIVEEASKVRLGQDMGAVISKEQLAFLTQAIGRAEKAGAKVLLDGRNAKAPQGYEGGFWLGPTILDQVGKESEAATVELFGPVLSIIRTQSMKEAMAIENANPYGNAASVFTNNGSVAEYIATNAKAGMVGVNVGVPVPREPFSFGGINESKFGHGDITGENSLNFWSNIKKVTTKWQQSNDRNWMS
jgi:malonate-semialdehyde dehydrogenase (acetylating)/methylmalonate-semialdehyde dehydrogenase